MMNVSGNHDKCVDGHVYDNNKYDTMLLTKMMLAVKTMIDNNNNYYYNYNNNEDQWQ